MPYTVAQLAQVAGVSVRTLHHYDEIGLLRPSAYSPSGYRLYERGEMLRLQQILFFKELDVSLQDIKKVMARKGFDPAQTLRQHRARLLEKSERIGRLIKTIERTIAYYEKEDHMLSDAEIYEGLTPDTIAEYKSEAGARWGKERVEASERKMKSLSKEQIKAMKESGEALMRKIAALMSRGPEAEEVQTLMVEHHKGIEFHYPCPAEVYKGLGNLYIEDDRFRVYFEQFKPGLAEFMQKAMHAYANRQLS